MPCHVWSQHGPRVTPVTLDSTSSANRDWTEQQENPQFQIQIQISERFLEPKQKLTGKNLANVGRLEESYREREVLCWKFDGRPQRRQQFSVVGGRRNPSLLPLGSAVAAAQKRARGRNAIVFVFNLIIFRNFSRNRDRFVSDLQERAALAAASDSYRYVEKRKPIPDPQVSTVVLNFVFSGGAFNFDWIGLENIQFWGKLMNLQETGLIYGNKSGVKKSEWSYWKIEGVSKFN